MTVKYKFPDREGRITIPAELRNKLGITQNTLFCIRENDCGSLTIQQQDISDASKNANLQVVEKETSLLDFINSLQPTEQLAVFRYLARKMAEDSETKQ